MYYYNDFPVYSRRQQMPMEDGDINAPLSPASMPGYMAMPMTNHMNMPMPMPTHSMPGMGAAPGMAPMPALPSGVPAGPIVAPIPGVPSMNGNGMMGGPTTTLDNPMFVPGFLKTQIGKLVRVEFLIGSSGPLVDRVGTLIGVGTSYILIRPVESDDVLLCDLYSIKFVTFMY